jgi:hypothetical protein
MAAGCSRTNLGQEIRGWFESNVTATQTRSSGFTIGVAGENAAGGAFRREKPRFAESGSGQEIVKALYIIAQCSCSLLRNSSISRRGVLNSLMRS